MDSNTNSTSSDVNSWFLNKFGPRIANAKPKEDTNAKEKEKMNIERYKNVRKQLEEQLAARRREEMQRRHRFYNADNELSNQNDDEEEEEEEEEFTDEEEQENGEEEEARVNSGEFVNANGDATQEKTDCPTVDEDANETDEIDVGSEVDELDCDSEDADISDADDEKKNTDVDDEEMEVVDDSNVNDGKSKRRRRSSSQISSASSKANSRKRRRLISSSSDDDNNNDDCDETLKATSPVEEERSSQADPPQCSGNEFSHISLDLYAATTATACSQDFNEALFLCSGTFGDNEDTPPEKSVTAAEKQVEKSRKHSLLNDDDLFTVEDDDDAKAETVGGESWPIRWADIGDDNDDNEEDNGEEDVEIRRKPIKMKDILDEEASLSGDDIDDVGGESDGEEDGYEPEAGDNDELPDEEEIREKLVRQYIKQTNDDDERRIIQLQEQFFADSDLHSATNMDRSFRFRMRDDADVDWNKLLGTVEAEDKENSDNDEDDESAKKLTEKKVEMLKWRLEMEKKKCVFNGSANVEYVELFEKSSLLMLGEKSIGNKVTKTHFTELSAHRGGGTSNDSELATLRARDSLLNKAGALRHVIKETSTTTDTTTYSLFTAPLKK